MAKSPTITATVANRMLDAGIGTVVNSGKIRIYDGVQPANAISSVTTQTLLVEFVLPTDAFPAAASAQLIANSIDPVAAVGTGDPTWYRLLTSADVPVMDGSVGLTNADLLIDTETIAADDIVSVVSFAIVQPTS